MYKATKTALRIGMEQERIVRGRTRVDKLDKWRRRLPPPPLEREEAQAILDRLESAIRKEEDMA